MIENTIIKKIVAVIRHPERGVGDRQLVHPLRDWLLGICIVCIGVIAGGGISFIMYKSTSIDNISKETISVPTIPYHREVVETANTKYSERRSRYDELIGQSSKVSASSPAVQQEATIASTTESITPSSSSTTTPLPVTPSQSPATAE